MGYPERLIDTIDEFIKDSKNLSEPEFFLGVAAPSMGMVVNISEADEIISKIISAYENSTDVHVCGKVLANYKKDEKGEEKFPFKPLSESESVQKWTKLANIEKFNLSMDKINGTMFITFDLDVRDEKGNFHSTYIKEDDRTIGFREREGEPIF